MLHLAMDKLNGKLAIRQRYDNFIGGKIRGFGITLFSLQFLWHEFYTGNQSSGRPHLGNLLGAIIPGIELSKKPGNDSLFFIADLHSLTTIREAELRRQNTLGVAAAWLAFGFDTRQNLLYRQSRIPEVTELTWYLSCFTPYPMLANSHAFKDKADRLADGNAGLFVYPVLMAADIIGYDANIVPVGKDQKQHLEITRDIASTFNNLYGETFVVDHTMQSRITKTNQADILK